MILLAIAMTFLHWLGGEGGYWYRDRKIRLLGCPVCLVWALGIGMGWHWSLVITGFALIGALSISDFGKWFWAWQGLAVAGAIGVYACFMGHLWEELGLLAIIPVGTYSVSRWCQPLDMWLRGAIYGAIPLILKFIVR